MKGLIQLPLGHFEHRLLSKRLCWFWLYKISLPKLPNSFFFRPTPLWLLAGRLTCSIHAVKINFANYYAGRLDSQKKLVMHIVQKKKCLPKTGVPNPHVGACGNRVFGVAL